MKDKQPRKYHFVSKQWNVLEKKYMSVNSWQKTPILTSLLALLTEEYPYLLWDRDCIFASLCLWVHMYGCGGDCVQGYIFYIFSKITRPI